MLLNILNHLLYSRTLDVGSINQRFITFEQNQIFISSLHSLRLGCHRANLDKSKTCGGHSINHLAISVKTCGQSDRRSEVHTKHIAFKICSRHTKTLMERISSDCTLRCRAPHPLLETE